MNFFNPNEASVNEKDKYCDFEREINYLIDFFDNFSKLNFCRFVPVLFDQKYFNLDATTFDSVVQTLKSIKLCCSIGSFSDANTLIRKLRDDLIQYLYILTIINNRKTFILEEFSFGENNESENPIYIKSFERINRHTSDDEKAVEAWFSNSIDKLPRKIKKKLEIENYMMVLKQNQDIAIILNDYSLDVYWKTLRSKLNDYVHNNGARFVTQNLIKVYNESFDTHLFNITSRTSYISSFFVVFLIMINSSLISSTDYADYMDCNMDPPIDCQYIVAPFVQDFINCKVTKLHPELKQYLKENNSNRMKIE